ncbi:MAG: TetR/AcrR family transcriptional regulator [Deltaproteobacteria bacterium]|nr:TetR/AcrR family transcriptional regulator [Deltaproteobacteria bacterium]MBW2413675.1 TetR/AcrR family transcriptional regulator [Deltaproteobacteria bacterium]
MTATQEMPLTLPPVAVTVDTAEPQTRRARKKQRTREQIYAAAMRLFGRGGFDGVTVEQICEAADVARGTFFRHFPTKAALLVEFNRTIAAEFAAAQPERDGDAWGDFRALVCLLVDRWLEQADVMHAMLRAFLSSPEAMLAARVEGRDLSQLLEEIVERGQASGEFRTSIDARLVAAVFLSGSTAILAGSVFRPGERRPDEIREQMLELVLHGLAAHPDARPGPGANPSPGENA